MQNQNDTTPSQVALNYIKSFEKGEDFTAPSSGIIINDHPDKSALDILDKYLKSEDAQVREKIVNLLVDIGIRSDTLTRLGAEVVRNKDIIKILVNAGLIKPDLGRERTMDALRKLVTQPDLAEFGKNFVQALEAKPSEETFLLIAKAKSIEAKNLVYKLAHFPEWRNVEAVKIAQAALGDDSLANNFINELKESDDSSKVSEFTQALGTLALIGTTETLNVIGSYLRTPLIFDLVGAYQKSVRLNVLEALLYNFPDQYILYPNNIKNDADYVAAEEFCAKQLGVKFTTPRPPFMTYIGYPIPARQ